ncbi:MAG: hypothetical protein AAFP84_08815, partial [Actinomycetota bacterium]
GFARNTGIDAATDGLAGAVVVRPDVDVELTHDGELLLLVGLTEEAGTLRVDGGSHRLGRAGSVAVPPGMPFAWADVELGHEVLVVTLPSGCVTST